MKKTDWKIYVITYLLGVIASLIFREEIWRFLESIFIK